MRESVVIALNSSDRPDGLEPGVPAKSHWHRAKPLLANAVFAGGLLTIVATAYLMVVSHSNTPIGDEWSALDSLATAPRPLPVSWLWEQYGQHRVIFHRLLLLADFRFFRGNHWIFFGAMFAVQLLFLALLGYLLWVIAGTRGWLWRSAIGVAAFCLFCPSQWENFGWALQISALAPGALLALALFELVQYDRTRARSWVSWIHLGVSIAAASAATFSNGNGMLCWPALIFAAAALRVPILVTAGYSVAGAAAIGRYQYDFVTGPFVPLLPIRHPLAQVEYVSSYFGGSFLRPPAPYHLAGVIGVSGLLAATLLTAWALRRRDRRSPVCIVLLALMAFSISTAVVTSLARSYLGLDQAFSSRYQTVAVVFWLSVALLLLLFVSGERRPAPMTIFLGSVLVVMVFGAGKYKFSLGASEGRALRAEAIGVGLMTDVRDRGITEDMYFPDAEVMWRVSAYLRQQHLMLFSTDLYRQLNTPLSAQYHFVSADHCLGQVDAIERLKTAESDGLRIEGWAIDRKTRSPAFRIVAAENGKITGFALTGFWRRELRAQLQSKRARYAGFQGYTQIGSSSRTVDIYAVISGSPAGLCPLTNLQIPNR